MPKAKNPPAGRGARVRAWLPTLAVLALCAALSWSAPSACDGYAALQWTRHSAAGAGPEAPRERLRSTTRQAVRAVERLAPLPQAAEAARLALGLGRRLERERPGEARGLYAQVRSALEGCRQSRWRGIGLGPVLEEARALEQSAAPVARP